MKINMKINMKKIIKIIFNRLFFTSGYIYINNKNYLQSYTPFFTEQLKPIKYYENAFLDKSDIIKDFKNNTIIYMWFNKITGEVYIGSSLKGNNRLNSYYWYLKLNSTKKSKIYNSINKYGHSNFSLAILEVCDHMDKKQYLKRHFL